MCNTHRVLFGSNIFGSILRLRIISRESKLQKNVKVQLYMIQEALYVKKKLNSVCLSDNHLGRAAKKGPF